MLFFMRGNDGKNEHLQILGGSMIICDRCETPSSSVTVSRVAINLQTETKTQNDIIVVKDLCVRCVDTLKSQIAEWVKPLPKQTK